MIHDNSYSIEIHWFSNTKSININQGDLQGGFCAEQFNLYISMISTKCVYLSIAWKILKGIYHKTNKHCHKNNTVKVSITDTQE